MAGERVGANLNRSLHDLFQVDDRVMLIGEDVHDPYGGAFKMGAGLSTEFPDRVLSTPLSESSFIGLGSGLALLGHRPIIEVMFADFLALCFDQLLNFASKSVTMYGRRIPIHLLVRAPVGGGRGYGPTHSQHPMKHFLGIPNLSLFEMSPFRDNRAVLDVMLDLGNPCLFFEDKILYTRPMYATDTVDQLFTLDLMDDPSLTARLYIEDLAAPEVLVISPGGCAYRALDALRRMFIEEERIGELLVPSRLYPFDVKPLVPVLQRARRICVVEDSAAGGTWGAELAHLIHTHLWGRLTEPVRLVSATEQIIPTAPHLERQVLPGIEAIQYQLTRTVA